MEELLPSVHRATTISALQDRTTQLESLKALQQDHRAVKSKMQWRLLDKAKTNRILRPVADTERDLNCWLAIAQT